MPIPDDEKRAYPDNKYHIPSPGDIVRVRAYGGEILSRRVVNADAVTVVVCNEVEYASALEERREPAGIGFPVDDVISVGQDRDSAGK